MHLCFYPQSHARIIAVRYSANHSECGEGEDTRSSFDFFIGFLERYFQILAERSLDTIYIARTIEHAPPTELAYKPGIPPTDEQITSWTKQVQEESFFGFDEIVSLSEHGINSMFSSLWSDTSRQRGDASLTEWHRENFSATFDSPVVRLMTNGKAIVWVIIKSGEMRVTK